MSDQPCDFWINSVHPREEGVSWFVECKTHHDNWVCPTLQYAWKHLDMETDFGGRGSKQKAQAALRRVAELPEQMVHS